MARDSKSVNRESEYSQLRTLIQESLDALQRNPSYDYGSIPAWYEELRRAVRVAQKALRIGDTAQAQPLLRDSLRNIIAAEIDVPSSGQLTLLAGLMRRLIVDYARARKLRETRGGMGALMDEMRQRLDTAATPGDVDVVGMDAALDELERRHPSSARLVELRYFADLGSLDIALELGISTVDVERNLRFARTWLFTHLQKRS